MISVSVDKATITSDLNVDSPVVVTVTSQMGFSGSVTLAVAAADASSKAISDWSATLDSTTVTVPQDGTATANLSLSALGDAAELAGTVTITATPGDTTVSPANATVGVTFNPVMEVHFKDDGNGTAIYPASNLGPNNPYKLKAGRQIAVYNDSPNKTLVVHTNNIVAGFPHEGSNPGTISGAAYTRTLTNAGDQDEFYCHHDQGSTTELLDPGNPHPNVLVVQ